MPKIGSLRIVALQKSYYYECHYKKGFGFYAKDFPAEIISYMQSEVSTTVNVASTEEGLNKNLSNALNVYYEKTKSKKKVIKVRAEVSTGLHMQPFNNGTTRGYSGNNSFFEGVDTSKNSKDTGGTEYSLGFDYTVGFVVTTNTEKFHKMDEEGVMSGYGYELRKNDIIIEYTDDKLAFLDDLRDALKSLGGKLFQLLTDESILNKMIESKTRLLPYEKQSITILQKK